MRSPLPAAAAVALLLLPSVAGAQDSGQQFASALAAGVEGFGQSFASAASGAAGVFVTATGRADLPAPLTDAYGVNIEARSASAVDAQRQRDAELAAARTVAAKFGVSIEVGSTAFAREIDRTAQSRRAQEIAAERAAHPGTVIVPPASPDPLVFVARTGVRFRSGDPARFPAFLDALKAAGVDLPAGVVQGGPGPLSILGGGGTQVLGFGFLESVDPAIWDRASQAAVAAARREAEALAGAAGRSVGEARQILLLSRSVQGSAASVTIGVRFATAEKGR